MWSQIVYHKKVLKANGKKELFQKSRNKQIYTINELKNNLKEILELNNVTVLNDSSQQPRLVYKSLDKMKEIADSEKQNMVAKLKNARNKQKNAQQQKLLPQFLEDPASLVNHYVQQLTKDTPDAPAEWYFAKVVKCIPASAPMKSKYHIVYDVQPDETFVAPLLLDLRNGDLIVTQIE